VLTPHLGYVTDSTFRMFYEDTVEAIAAWRRGTPVGARRVLDDHGAGLGRRLGLRRRPVRAIGRAPGARPDRPYRTPA
jgi:hypothetical protein